MTSWTVHLHRIRPPVLIPERFSWGALLFGPFWLAVHRAWVPAALVFVAFAVIVLFAPAAISGDLALALAVLLGLSGQDLRRWSIAHRGYVLSQVIVAPSETGALARLLDRKPELAASFLPASARS